MRKHKDQQGATLIEIAITVLILSTSLLAMATLQARSLQFNKGSSIRSQANIFAYDIMDRIRINRGSSSVTSTYNIENYTADYAATPSGNDLAISDVAEWRANLVNTLPSGKGKIACSVTTRICTVTIEWSEEQMFGTATGDSSSKLIYSTAI